MISILSQNFATSMYKAHYHWTLFASPGTYGMWKFHLYVNLSWWVPSFKDKSQRQEGDGGIPPLARFRSDGETISAPVGIVGFGSVSLLNTTHGGTSMACGPYVVTLLDWTFMFEWYMTRLVVKNNHEKKTHVTMQLDYVFRLLDTYFNLILNFTIGMTHMIIQREGGKIKIKTKYHGK